MFSTCMPQICFEKLETLRKSFCMGKLTGSTIDAYIILNNDAHMSEYLCECDKRLEYISGFKGSSGAAVVTLDKALLWTDSRYYEDVKNDLSPGWLLITTLSINEWLVKYLKKGSKIGIDPSLINYKYWDNLKTNLNKFGVELISIKINLIDLIWDNKPQMPQNSIIPMKLKYTGESVKNKINKIKEKMKEKNVEIYIVSALDEIAWVLNLRGSDIEFNPVFFSYLVITTDIHLFVDQEKIGLTIKNHFNQEEIEVNIYPYDSIHTFISFICNSNAEAEKVWISGTANYEIHSLVPKKKIICEPSIIGEMKAIKNPQECQGMIDANIKDGVALCRFFSWLSNNFENDIITEFSAAEKLESFRKDDPEYVGPSFPTISSSGPNSSIIHYKPTEYSDRQITRNEIYLCDSGAHYLCGTTDITRSMYFGKPTEFQKDCFTRVFKGYVALAKTIFPNKILGYHLDVIARTYLWEVGLDYGHGTGHGVGSYLFVHEGPIGISKFPYPDDPGLQENMFVTIEPGFYQEKVFGIRIENIFRIIKSNIESNFKDVVFLEFKPISLCPIQVKMLNLASLSSEEVKFLNSYHKTCLEVLGPILKEKGYTDGYNWLVEATKPL